MVSSNPTYSRCWKEFAKRKRQGTYVDLPLPAIVLPISHLSHIDSRHNRHWETPFEKTGCEFNREKVLRVCRKNTNRPNGRFL